MVTSEQLVDYRQLHAAIEARVQAIFAIWRRLYEKVRRSVEDEWGEDVKDWCMAVDTPEIVVEVSNGCWNNTHFRFSPSLLHLPNDELESAVEEAFRASPFNPKN